MKKVFYYKDSSIAMQCYTKSITEVKKEDYAEMPPLSKRNQKLSFDEIFSLFNDPIKNPLSMPEKQECIIDNKLHTSMSVGDIIEVNGVPNICMPEGWKEIKWQNSKVTQLSSTNAPNAITKKKLKN